MQLISSDKTDASGRSGQQDSTLPRVTFVIPTLNAGAALSTCLESIVTQQYPKAKMEILVCDGGSSDHTTKIAAHYHSRVLENLEKLAEPGVALGIQESTGDVNFVLAADNELRGRNWIRSMVRPFVIHNDLSAVFTHVVNSKSESAITRYLNMMHADPFNWFLYERGASCDPRLMSNTYPCTKFSDYQVFAFPVDRVPLLAFAQGFGLKKGVERKAETAYDDITPVINMIENGAKMAYVPSAGIYHHQSIDSLQGFIRKFSGRVDRDLRTSTYGYRARLGTLSLRRRFRQLMWIAYSASLVIPFVDSIRGTLRDKDPAWFYHPIASLGLTTIIATSFLKRR